MVININIILALLLVLFIFSSKNTDAQGDEVLHPS